MFISVEKKLFQAYVTDVLSSLNEYYVWWVLQDEHGDLLGEATKIYEAYEEVK